MRADYACLAYKACGEEMASAESASFVPTHGAHVRPAAQGRGPHGGNSFSLGTVFWGFSGIFFSPSGSWPNSRVAYHEPSCLLAVCRAERVKDRL